MAPFRCDFLPRHRGQPYICATSLASNGLYQDLTASPSEPLALSYVSVVFLHDTSAILKQVCWSRARRTIIALEVQPQWWSWSQWYDLAGLVIVVYFGRIASCYTRGCQHTYKPFPNKTDPQKCLTHMGPPNAVDAATSPPQKTRPPKCLPHKGPAIHSDSSGLHLPQKTSGTLRGCKAALATALVEHSVYFGDHMV